jgi:hypothetical protein
MISNIGTPEVAFLVLKYTRIWQPCYALESKGFIVSIRVTGLG